MRERPAELLIYCKAWPVRNGTRFLKTAFELNWQQQRIRCPNQQEMPFEPGGTVHFPGRDLCHLSLTRPLHQQSAGAQCQHSS